MTFEAPELLSIIPELQSHHASEREAPPPVYPTYGSMQVPSVPQNASHKSVATPPTKLRETPYANDMDETLITVPKTDY